MKRTIRTSKANNWRHKLQPIITKRPIMAQRALVAAQRHAEQRGWIYGRRLTAMFVTIALCQNATDRAVKRHAGEN